MEVFQEILNKHLGKAVGVILGLIYGLLAIKYGFFKALFVLICAALGYYIGKRLDEKVDFRELFLRLFRER
ncbi:hypothetical protein Psch_00194 [Pelotomaculum schinkii]|uniref:DUF2273 domain-containing protein n=1 Tax=Pelotomaculum schinkii TaxID=78350 RepID=A0A4Y7RCW5_9FIRM|nr:MULTISPECIES: DUF2273 domain-containing protein [Pelotomaculum]TEB06662.1 hypothetical protein Psch_00194 [Pelotomaculum schinkii]TEB17543.1 hypothetical protein Psfp_00415 [Pelotomaculum sp. FP]